MNLAGSLLPSIGPRRFDSRRGFSFCSSFSITLPIIVTSEPFPLGSVFSFVPLGVCHLAGGLFLPKVWYPNSDDINYEKE